MYKQANIVEVSLKTNDLRLIKPSIKLALQNENDFQHNLYYFSYLQYVPFLREYYMDALHLDHFVKYTFQTWEALASRSTITSRSQIYTDDNTNSLLNKNLYESIIFQDITKDDKKAILLSNLASKEINSVKEDHYRLFPLRRSLLNEIAKAKKLSRVLEPTNRE